MGSTPASRTNIQALDVENQMLDVTVEPLWGLVFRSGFFFGSAVRYLQDPAGLGALEHAIGYSPQAIDITAGVVVDRRLICMTTQRCTIFH